MLYRKAFCAILPALLTTAAFAADATFERTLSVSGVPTLNVGTGSGYIHVYPGPDNQIHVIGHVHATPSWFGGGDPQERVRAVVASPPVTQAGNIVSIGRTDEEPEMLRNVSIDYEITAPAHTNLKAHTGSGDLEIGGILGSVSANSGSGGVHVENVGGDSHFGTGSGSIRADHVHGAASADTGSGHVELSVDAPGDVVAKTGSGGIQVSGVQGGLQASAGSGSIEAEGDPRAEWRLNSGSGSIHLKLAQAAHFNLNASTGSGSIKVNRAVAMQGELNHHHVTGTVNGGGPTVRASTGSGSITID